MLPYWYMKLSWPDKYGLSAEDGPAIWRDSKRAIEANKITHINEGTQIGGWVSDMDKRFAPKDLSTR